MEEVPGEDPHRGHPRARPGRDGWCRRRRIKLPALPRHLLTGEELSATELTQLLDRALALKAAPAASRALEGRTVALLFEKPSTRTRTSFEVGIVELGGHPMVLRPAEMQLSRGESARDTALVLSRHVAAIGLRTGSEDTLAELAEHATVPVINMLSPRHHPCQALADLMTLREAVGTLDGRRIAYVGDGNNVARSLAILGARAGVEVAVASPDGHQLENGLGAELSADPRAAAAGADAVYTDVWVSMSDDEVTAGARRAALAPYRIDDDLLDAAAPDAFALHCLPAHPGEEITASRALRRAPAHLGPGREPPARLEGAARAARFGAGRSRVGASGDGGGEAPGRGRRGARARPRRAEPLRDLISPLLNSLELMVLTRERVQAAVDDAVERGRMTRKDATELVSAPRHDRPPPDRGAARRPRALRGRPLHRPMRREVDRARPAAGLGPSFPITGYDDLTAAQITARLGDLTPAELRKVRDYERRNANRKTVLAAIDHRID